MRPVPVNLLMIVLIVSGVYSGLTLTREFFPETTPDRASVRMPFPGATPAEIEESLARKVEDKLVDLDEVDQMRTTLAEGGGGITIEFRDGVNIGKAVDEVERAVDALIDLPADAERITVAEVKPRLPVIMVDIFGDADEEAKKQAINGLRDDLESLPGMGEISVSGVRDYEIRVDISSDALLEHGLTLPQVAEKISAAMADVPGGSVRSDTGTVNVRTMGVVERAEEIRNIVVRADTDGQLLRVGDIGTVIDGFVDEEFEMRFSTHERSGPSASVTVYRVGDQDAVDIAEMVRAYVRARKGEPFEQQALDRVYDAINAMASVGGRSRSGSKLQTNRSRAYDLGLQAEPLPPGTAIETHSDLARFIEGRLDLLLRNARWGALLVFATLFLTLNWRAAIWVGVGLSTALCGALVMMSVTGITLNLLTMFGLIIVLGLLVDDAIVVAENIQARHDRGEPALVAAVKGAEEVFWPVVATVLTSIVAFLPLTFVKGTVGDLLSALPFVVTCALIMSLVESVLILPSHMGHTLKRRDRLKPSGLSLRLRRAEAWRDALLMERIVPAYSRLLQLLLRYRYMTLTVALATLMGSIGMVVGGRLDFTFLATSDAETLVIDLRMPTGTPLAQTSKVIERIEAAAASQNETKSVSTLVGVSVSANDSDGLNAAGIGSHIGQLFVELLPVEERTRDSAEVIASIRQSVGVVDGIESLKYSAIEAGPGGPDISVQVVGSDEQQIELVVSQVKQLLGGFEGVFDIADDTSYGQRELWISLKPGATALGFTVENVARQIRGGLYGIDAHVFSSRREDIDVRVRVDERARRSLYEVENIWISNPSGERVPMSEIAELSEGSSYTTIKRIDRQRAVTVTAATAPGTNPEAIVFELTDDFDRLQQQHPGVTIDLSGRQRQMAKAFESLPIGFMAAVVLIYVILAWLFSSYTQPLVVMLAIPFGMIGVVWGHLLLGYQMTFLSLIGFVALSGIVVNDSLILVQFFNDLRAAGAGLVEGLIEAGRRRLRPIFLTTITTVLGLTPLMLEQSFQARFLIPMAIAIAFGLMSATVLILLVLPCLILISDDCKRVAYFLWYGTARPGDHEGDQMGQMEAE
jgi:multidrug efflux pump subunit AcrB